MKRGKCLHGCGCEAFKRSRVKAKRDGRICTCSHEERRHALEDGMEETTTKRTSKRRVAKVEIAPEILRVAKAFDELRDAVLAALLGKAVRDGVVHFPPAPAPVPVAYVGLDADPAPLTVARRPRPERKASEPGALGKCERMLIVSLARSEQAISRAALAVRSGYSVDSGGYANALGKIRSAGLVIGVGGNMMLSKSGEELAATLDDEPPADRIGYWCARVGKCGAAILRVLVDVHSTIRTVTREELARIAGYSPDSGGFANALGRLRSLELVDGLRASDALMVDR